MIKKVKLSKFNGNLCENLYGDIQFITEDKFNDVMDLFERVNNALDNKNWLKFRDAIYLKNVLDNGGFIVGCYVEETLVASALCEVPVGDYKDILVEMGMDSVDINSTYISGYVMVDPIYRGNSLHRTLLETRMELSIPKDKRYIVTAVATENIFSLKTILGLGFDIKLQKENQYGIVRNILIKDLYSNTIENVNCTA